MKIRKGFVSNSSSSSFVIGIDDPIEESLVIIKKLIDFFKVPFDSPLYPVVTDIIDYLSTPDEGPYDIKKIEEDWYKPKNKYSHKYWYLGSIYTDDWEAAEMLLMNYLKIEIDDEDLFIYSDGSF